MQGLARPSDRRPPLPRPLTPFVGRERELADLRRLLADPDCRLLTLVGPGGFGKTRLALQAAAQVAGSEHEPCFVDLPAVRAPGRLAQAIADALGLPLAGAAPPSAQLISHLREKRCLLVLDNFEHLLDLDAAPAEAIAFLGDLLEAAPGVKALVTSREALNLLGEWRYPVGGLSIPPAGPAPAPVETYGAVQLFVQAARRVSPDFSPADEADGIARLCRMVEGMPLALELAAAWTRTLTCAAIADEIAGGAELLHANLRNLPEHHRSVQAIFRQTWERLTAEEQTVFARLAVFRAGFEVAAALPVAGATLPILGALLDKALLQRDADGRYSLHELLRQFAEARLAETPDLAAETRARHADYYADYLKGWQADMQGGQQAAAIRHIAANLDNIRAAWGWLVENADLDGLQKAAYALHYYFQFQSRYREGAETFAQAARSLAARHPPGPVLAEALVYQGWFCIRLGQFATARTVLEQSRSILESLDLPAPAGTGRDPVNALGLLAVVVGDYDEARRLGEAARRTHAANDDAGNLMDAHYVLTSAALAQGEYNAARRHAQQAYALSQSLNDRWMMAYILNDLGSVARALGDYAQAREHFQASYDLRLAFNDPEGMAVALSHLGRVARLQNDYAGARTLYTRSCALYRDLNDRGGLASALLGMGEAAMQTGDWEAARDALRQALQIAVEIEWRPFALTCLVAAAELWRRTGDLEQAVPVLTLAARHPGADRETREAAAAGLVDLMEALPPERFAAAQAQAAPEPDQRLAPIAQAVLAMLATPRPAAAPPPTPARRPGPALAEPITERELEVLRLVAQGLKNQEIADRLVITRGTVRVHINNLYRKLDVNNRVQAVGRARALGLL